MSAPANSLGERNLDTDFDVRTRESAPDFARCEEARGTQNRCYRCILPSRASSEAHTAEEITMSDVGTALPCPGSVFSFTSLLGCRETGLVRSALFRPSAAFTSAEDFR